MSLRALPTAVLAETLALYVGHPREVTSFIATSRENAQLRALEILLRRHLLAHRTLARAVRVAKMRWRAQFVGASLGLEGRSVRVHIRGGWVHSVLRVPRDGRAGLGMSIHVPRGDGEEVYYVPWVRWAACGSLWRAREPEFFCIARSTGPVYYLVRGEARPMSFQRGRRAT